MIRWAWLCVLSGAIACNQGSGTGDDSTTPGDGSDDGGTSPGDSLDDGSEAATSGADEGVDDSPTSSADDTNGDDGSDSSGGPENWPRPTVGSGSRLRERVYRTSDGGGLHRGWFDETLQTDCQFLTTSDGVERCVPLAYSGSVYADASCSQPAAYGGCNSNPAFAMTLVDGLAHVFDATSAVQSGTVYFRTGQGDCLSFTTGNYVLVGAERPATDFVGATRAPATDEDAPSPEAVRPWVRTADDGSFEVLGPYHMDLETAALHRGWGPDDLRRWVPDVPNEIGFLHADAACSTNVVMATPDGMPPTDLFIERVGSPLGCPAQVVYDGAGAAVAAETTIYIDYEGPCSAWTVVGEDQAFELGPALDLAPAPTFEIDHGDVVAVWAGNAEGQPLVLDHYRDDIHGVRCAPVHTAAGWRCLPSGGQYGVYADAACTTVLAYSGSFYNPGCEDLEPTKFVTTGASTCTDQPGQSVVYSVGDPIATPSVVYQLTSVGQCVASGLTTTGYTWYPVTGTVDPSTFPALTLETE